MIVQKYNKCIFCGSKKLKLKTDQKFKHNFYTSSIKNDLNINDNFFKKIKVYNCENCYIIQNNPWFTPEICFKIFNQIYGQHNRNWVNVINFFKNGIKPDHGNLFDLIKKNIKIKNYCEFNAPFMGLMIDFYSQENKKNLKYYKEIFEYSIKYLSSRQLAGVPNHTRRKKYQDVKKYLKKIHQLKKNIYTKSNIKKTIIIDNTYLGWLYNDNYRSVNSRSLASELLDINIKDINIEKNPKKFDLFGIFNTLDHTHQPKKIFDYALNNSKYVLIYSHSDLNLEKQHLFSLTDKFINYLNKRKIFYRNLTLDINKQFKSKEMYILCSKFHKINLNFNI